MIIGSPYKRGWRYGHLGVQHGGITDDGDLYIAQALRWASDGPRGVSADKVTAAEGLTRVRRPSEVFMQQFGQAVGISVC